MGFNAVRELNMGRLRAGIRKRYIGGAAHAEVVAWIDHQEAKGTITEQEAIIGRLVAQHYLVVAERPARRSYWGFSVFVAWAPWAEALPRLLLQPL
jgi:hypothetical protein